MAGILNTVKGIVDDADALDKVTIIREGVNLYQGFALNIPTELYGFLWSSISIAAERHYVVVI